MSNILRPILYLFCLSVLLVQSEIYAQDSLIHWQEQLEIDERHAVQYDLAIKIARYYRDSVYSLAQERLYLQKALDITNTGDLKNEKALTITSIGIHHLNQSHYDSAHYYFEEAQDAYEIVQDTSMRMYVKEYVANAYQQQNKLTEALETYLDVILEYESHDKFESYCNSILTRCNASYIQILQKNYNKSIEYLRPCFEIYNRYKDDEEKRKFIYEQLSVNYNLYMARAFEEMQELDSAEMYYNTTLATSLEIKYPFTEGYAYLGLGIVESDKNQNFRKARDYFEKAAAIFKNMNYKEGLAPSLAHLSQSHIQIGNLIEAELKAEEALESAIEINQHEGIKDSYKALADIAIKKNEYKTAFELDRKREIYEDSILNLAQSRIQMGYDSRYKKLDQDREIEVQNITIKQQEERNRLNFIIFLVSLFGLAALAYFLFTRNKLKQAQKAANYEKEVSTALNKFVPNAFLSTLGRNHILEVELGDQIEQEVTVVFTDIRSFTSISENMTPNENFKFVKAYAEKMGPIITKNNGFINQYLGDGIMAIFQESAEDALIACIEMQAAIIEFNKEHVLSGGQAVKVGMGLHSGPLVMGIIGDEHRQDAALISDTVNTSARLESLTKDYKVSIILSKETLERIEDQNQYQVRHLGESKVKGKEELVSIYECVIG